MDSSTCVTITRISTIAITLRTDLLTLWPAPGVGESCSFRGCARRPWGRGLWPWGWARAAPSECWPSARRTAGGLSCPPPPPGASAGDPHSALPGPRWWSPLHGERKARHEVNYRSRWTVLSNHLHQAGQQVIHRVFYQAPVDGFYCTLQSVLCQICTNIFNMKARFPSCERIKILQKTLKKNLQFSKVATKHPESK